MQNSIGIRLGGMGRTFSPSQLSNLAADWDPTLVTKDGSDLVSQLNDRTGTHPFLQATGAAKPTWIANSMNGQPILRFAGSHFMQLATAAQLSYERTQAWTMYTVLRVTGAATDQCILAKGNPAGQGFGFSAGNGGTVNNVRVAIASSGANRIIGDATATLQNNNRVIVVTYDGSSAVGGVNVYVNGSSVAVGATVNTLSATIINALNFTLGFNQIAAYLTGDFARGGVYSRVLATAERSSLTRFLGLRYGITVA
jgi:hypothetical protein